MRFRFGLCARIHLRIPWCFVFPKIGRWIHRLLKIPFGCDWIRRGSIPNILSGKFLGAPLCRKAIFREMRLPEITEDIIDECLDEIPIEVDREYIRTFILCGQDRVREITEMDGELSEDEEPNMGLTL